MQLDYRRFTRMRQKLRYQRVKDKGYFENCHKYSDAYTDYEQVLTNLQGAVKDFPAGI